VRQITILLVDDVSQIRESLRSLLTAEVDLSLVGEAEDGLQAVTMAAKLHPDVILMDLSMPRLNGLEAMQRIMKARPVTKVPFGTRPAWSPRGAAQNGERGEPGTSLKSAGSRAGSWGRQITRNPRLSPWVSLG